MQKLSSPIKLIEDSFKIFFVKENLIYFVSIYLILVPFQVFQYFQGSLIGPTSADFKFTPMTGVVGVVNLIYFVIYLLTSAAGILAVKNVFARGSLNFRETYMFAWNNLWSFLILSSLIFLAVLGGTILLIIPGIIFGIWFSFSKFILFDTGTSGKEAMAKSHELVRGRFWQVLGRFIVFGIFAGLVGFLFSVVPYGIGGVVVGLAGALFILPSYLLYKELSV